MSKPYQPRYQWAPTWPDNVKPNEPVLDFAAHDGDERAGRVYKATGGPQDKQWQWCGAHPSTGWRGNPIMPNSGFEDTAGIAVQRCEEYWDAMKQLVEDQRFKPEDEPDQDEAQAPR